MHGGVLCHGLAEPVLVLPAIMFTTFHLEASAAAVSTKLQHSLQSFQQENGESRNTRQMIVTHYIPTYSLYIVRYTIPHSKTHYSTFFLFSLYQYAVM